MYKIIILTILTFSLSSCQQTTRVSTNHGILIGKKSDIYRHITEFLGVPFAEPPVGDLRFQPPVELNSTAYGNGFEAVKRANTCFYNRINNGFRGVDEWNPLSLPMSEDCLQLNMWVPKRKSGAVLIFIFGRGYHAGSPSIPFNDGNSLALNTKAIVITINYRLGAFGFSYLEGKIPGNIGLLDQQMALKWIYKNIEYFGGNRNLITIFGHGTGGSSVTAHLFSKESERYFSRAIALSGTIENKWSSEKNDVIEDNFRKLMEILNCTEGNDDDKIECMKVKDPKNIVQGSLKISNPKQSKFVGPFLAVEEDDVFFKGNVKMKLRNKDMKQRVSLMIGHAAGDAAYYLPQYLKGDLYNCQLNPKIDMEAEVNQCNMNETNLRNAIRLVRDDYGINDEEFIDEVIAIYDPIYRYYENKYRRIVIRFYTDILFSCDIVNFGKKVANYIKKKKYYYVMNKRSTYNPWPLWMGPTHTYELMYLFGHSYNFPEKYNNSDRHDEKCYSFKIMRILKKFAETGETFINWRSFVRSYMNAAVLNENLEFSKISRRRNVDTKTCRKIQYLLNKYK
uniref:Acetylcholinesterase n=1 Tax=Parastrongyloides trichosuri TaxID=131310 RepID=A0A0N5A6M4_PARTI